MTKPAVPVEAVLRLAWSLVAVIGLAGLAWSLGSQVGGWAAWLVLLAAGGGVAVPLWRRHLEEQSALREQDMYRPEMPQRPHEVVDPDRDAY